MHLLVDTFTDSFYAHVSDAKWIIILLFALSFIRLAGFYFMRKWDEDAAHQLNNTFNVKHASI